MFDISFHCYSALCYHFIFFTLAWLMDSFPFSHCPLDYSPPSPTASHNVSCCFDTDQCQCYICNILLFILMLQSGTKFTADNDAKNIFPRQEALTDFFYLPFCYSTLRSVTWCYVYIVTYSTFLRRANIQLCYYFLSLTCWQSNDFQVDQLSSIDELFHILLIRVKIYSNVVTLHN